MIKILKDRTNIVLLGAWNRNIFSPKWLLSNIFVNIRELELEIGVQPGLPNRLIGEEIVLIPQNTKLIIAPQTYNDTVLLRLQSIAKKILETLQHTPVSAVGLNFVFQITEPSLEIINKFPSDLFGEVFTDSDLTIKTREYKWQALFEDRIINLSINLDDSGIIVEVNFHKNVSSASEASSAIDDNLLRFKSIALKLLTDITGLETSDIQVA
ncbi:MAG: hypothetical protein ACRKGH_09385 [Dehalogenimonas sp.]